MQSIKTRPRPKLERQVSLDSTRSRQIDGQNSIADGRPRPFRSLGSNNTPSAVGGLDQRQQQHAKLSRKISDLYKNPQLYTGLWQNSKATQWNFYRSCLLLAPLSFSLHFFTVLVALFSVPNLAILGVPTEAITSHFFVSGIFGAALIFLFQRLVRRFYVHRRRLLTVVLTLTCSTAFGLILVLVANVRSYMYINSTEDKTSILIHVGERKLAASNLSSQIHQEISTTYTLEDPQKILEHATIIPSNPHMLAITADTSPLIMFVCLVGYALVSSSLGSGQYLLQSVMMTSTHADHHQHVVTIATLSAGAGGFAVSAFSAITFQLGESSYQHILSQVMIMCILGLILLVAGAVSFTVAWRRDTRDLRAVRQAACSISQPRTRPPSRTPQEIFDECAHLLGRHTTKMPGSPYHSRLPKYYDPESQRFVSRQPDDNAEEVGVREKADIRISPGQLESGLTNTNDADRKDKLPNSRQSSEDKLRRQLTLSSDQSEISITHSQTAAVLESTEILKRYSYAVPRVPKEAHSGRPNDSSSMFSSASENWKIVLVFALAFFLSNSSTSFEYTSTMYLALTERAGTVSMFDQRKEAIRDGSGALFLVYLAYTSGLLLYTKFQDHLGWKKLTAGLTLLTSLLTLLTSLRPDWLDVLLPAALFHGLMKVLVLALPHLLTLRTVRSRGGQQTESRRQLLIESPTTVLWCLVPLSLALTGATIGPLVYVTGRATVALVYSGVSGFIGCMGLITML